MEAFLQIAVLIAFLAGGAILFRLRLAPSPRATDLLIKMVLWVLLFVMGFRLGNSRELSSRLAEIGLLAAGVAVFALAGTVIAIRVAYDVLDGIRRFSGSTTAGPMMTADSESIAHPAVGGKAHAAAPGWRHFKGPAVLLGVVILGLVLGVILPEWRGVDYGSVTGWVLNALLFMIGVQFAQSGLSLKTAFARIDTILVPAATVVGSLAGGLAVAAVFGLSVGKGLSLSAGFGWYSLSGVLIADMGDAALGSAAFLANMLREAIALLLIPILAASKRPYTAIGAGGATAMDVTLPLIEQCAGPASVPVSFASGAMLSLLVPVLVPLFYRLG